MNNNNNIKEFRILYNRLDEILSSKVKELKKMSFVQKLNKYADQYPSYSFLKNEIRLIHDLRNVIIHEEKYREDITIPTDSFLKRINEIIKIIENPQTAIDIASMDIYSCNPDDRIIDVIDVMAEKIYGQVPVFSDKENLKGLIGVFAEACIIALLGRKERGSKKGILLEESAKIGDILELIKIPINECWDFVPKDLDVYKVQKLFHTKTFKDARLKDARLGVLFVTESGNPSEKVQGIITTWDLSKIGQLHGKRNQEAASIT